MRILTLLTYFEIASASAGYHYIPVEFDYGANSRVTANFTFGTAADAEPVKVVMDSGSANFWVSSMLPFPSNALTGTKALGTKRNRTLGLPISRRRRTLQRDRPDIIRPLHLTHQHADQQILFLRLCWKRQDCSRRFLRQRYSHLNRWQRLYHQRSIRTRELRPLPPT